MTLCPTCRPLAATTEAQHANRMRNIEIAEQPVKGEEYDQHLKPKVDIWPCRSCGSREWATTREFIKPEPERPRTLLQRLFRLRRQ